MSLIDSLKKDIHYIESLNSCMNCGVCTAICPSAEFYNYDPRIIADTVQRQDEESIEGLLKSDTIWYCGECMSCKTRCPRCNTPGGIIMALRRLSQEKGWFTESEKGRQQFALKRILGNNILNYGYCVTKLNRRMGVVVRYDALDADLDALRDKTKAAAAKVEVY